MFCPFRSELIQLVAVTQKTAERSYRELIEQQIQTYQRRSVTSSALASVCLVWSSLGAYAVGAVGETGLKLALNPKPSILVSRQ